MIEIKNKANCTGCTACASICPKNAIKMVANEEGFRYPVIDKEKCINCNLCSKVCPMLKQYNIDEKELKFYAAYNKNISDITKELVYGGVGVEKIGYEGEDLEEYYTNLLSEVKSNETA